MPRSKAPKARLKKAEQKAWKDAKVKKDDKADHPAMVTFTLADDAKFPKAR